MTAPPASPSSDGRSLVAIYRRLSALAAAPAATPATVTAVLATAIGATVALVGPQLRVLAAATPAATGIGTGTGDGGTGDGDLDAATAVRERLRGPHPAPWARVPGAAGVPARPLRVPGPDGTVAVLAPVVAGEQVQAHLVGEYHPEDRDPDAPDDETVLLAVEHAAVVVGVLLGRDRALTAATGRVRDDLVSGLLLGRPRDRDEAARWAGHLGHEIDAPHRVLLVAPVDLPAGTGETLLSEADEHLRRAVPRALTVVRDGEVAAVLPVAADPVAVGTACARRLARGRTPDPESLWPVTVAVGGEARDAVALAVSYDQACRTLVAAGRLGGTGRLLRFDDLGVHRLLLQIPDPAAAREFAAEVLGRLVDGGDGVDPRSERTADVLRTLARWFREDGSPQRTARALSVHPNTVSYRLRRAEELSGLSLESYDDRLAAQVALEILGEMRG